MIKLIFRIDLYTGTPGDYIDAWKAGSKLIQEYDGAMGTILHHQAGRPSTFLAVATWRDRESREAAMKAIEADPVKKAVCDRHLKLAILTFDGPGLGYFEIVEEVKPSRSKRRIGGAPLSVLVPLRHI